MKFDCFQNEDFTHDNSDNDCIGGAFWTVRAGFWGERINERELKRQKKGQQQHLLFW